MTLAFSLDVNTTMELLFQMLALRCQLNRYWKTQKRFVSVNCPKVS